MESRPTAPCDAGTLRGVVTIVVVGIALGVTFNGLGLGSRHAWGLSWVGVDQVGEMPKLEELVTQDQPDASSASTTTISDPMAVGLGEDSAELPEIPDLDRPIEIGLDAVRQFVDANAAVIIDAREPDEYASGHIPGALNLPYEEVTSEPERLESLDAGGKPIVVYCGGGTCELSLGLAWDLVYAGQRRVVVYMGGFGEWTEAGYPVDVPAGS